MGNEDKTPVDGDMLIAEILRKYPEAAYVLMNCGVNYELGLTAAE